MYSTTQGIASGPNYAANIKIPATTIYVVHRRSDWAGIGAVDAVVGAGLTEQEAWDAGDTDMREGQYGQLRCSCVQHDCPKAIATLIGKGAVLDATEGGRIWIGDQCLVCSAADVKEFRSRGHKSARPITREEAEYIDAAANYVSSR